MKKIFVLLILLIFADKAYCDYTITSPQYYNTNPVYYGSPTPQRHLSRRSFDNLERRILNQSYKSENNLQRLSRMEEAMFGAVQSGDINSRYAALNKALTKSDYQNTYNPQKRSFWNNVLNAFSYSAGVPTGFTPPVTNGYYDDNNNYVPYGYQQGYYDDYGNYRSNAYNIQSGTRVRILD